MENNNKLAKLSLAINAVLIIFIIMAFVKIGKSNSNLVSVNNTDTTSTGETVHIEPTGKIGFFNLDSLNSQLALFKEIEQEMQNSAKNAENKMKKKQAEINAWEQKWSKKGQLLSSEQEQYMKEAQNMQNDAMQFEQNVQMKMVQEQESLMQTYALRLSNFTKDYAQDNGFDAVFAYQFGQSLWYYNPALDITNDLAKIMNDDYASSTGATEEIEEE